MKNFKGFTLAEVLITLSILGVVAAIIIPNVIQSYRRSFVEKRLLKIYSTLENALEMSQAENGNFKTWSNGWYSGSFDMPYIGKNYIEPYLNIDYKCKYSSNTKPNRMRCINDPSKSAAGNEIYLSNNHSGCNDNLEKSTCYRLKDGMSLGVTSGVHGSYGYRVIHFLVDIDGPDKGKSQLGADLFYFTLKYFVSSSSRDYGNVKLLPGFLFQADGEAYYTKEQYANPNYVGACSKTENFPNYAGTKAGAQCAALIAKNNWKIPKDYPIKF